MDHSHPSHSRRHRTSPRFENRKSERVDEDLRSYRHDRPLRPNTDSKAPTASRSPISPRMHATPPSPSRTRILSAWRYLHLRHRPVVLRGPRARLGGPGRLYDHAAGGRKTRSLPARRASCARSMNGYSRRSSSRLHEGPDPRALPERDAVRRPYYGSKQRARPSSESPPRMWTSQKRPTRALPQAPTYYSPTEITGPRSINEEQSARPHVPARLHQRSRSTMLRRRRLSRSRPQPSSSIIAPHFVFYIEQYLEDKYGF